jgi:hypothetical protein
MRLKQLVQLEVFKLAVVYKVVPKEDLVGKKAEDKLEL